MHCVFAVLLLWALAFVAPAFAAHATDSLMDGDSPQSGYLPNHNMDPNIITGGGFGQIWQYKASIPNGGNSDEYYAKLLVYTPTSLGRQVVLAFSKANRMYILDAVNGSVVASRDLANEGEGPFIVSDLPSCNDIGQTIGITGTPVIDPSTDTVYFWAKSYGAAGQSGWQNGAYRFHAIDSATLKERPGFPTNIQGAPADNDNTRRFTGGDHLQRTGLNLINGIVYAGFGAHCDLFNYTGWVIGMSTAGKYVTGYATFAGPGSPAEDGTYNGGGGAAGIWMAGSAIASDNSGRLFVATGNGKGTGLNQASPAPGHIPMDTLAECMVNLMVNSNGSLTQQDYFQPATYNSMDLGDRDLGSGGVVLPDPSVFSGGGVSRLAITCGKIGNCFVANADDLGGYKMGSGSSDAIIQTLTPPGGGFIFGNPGTYPLEGGYLYVTPVGEPTYVYSLGFDNKGRPTFTQVAQTNETAPGAVGVGPAVITTLNGQAGTGILWVCDTNGVRAYNAVPVNGKMTRITLPATGGLTKFSRVTFGDGRYYMTTSNGQILGFGAPVALPLTCTSPVDFGSVQIGNSSTLKVTCTANIAITKVKGLTVSNSIFQALNSSLPTGSLAAGASFSFPVTFNLSTYVLNSGSTSSPSVSPGVLASALTLYTTNVPTGYSTQQSISLSGKVVVSGAYLSVSPLQVTFPGIVVGSSAQTPSTSTFLLQNTGESSLTILGYAFSTNSDGPFTNVTMSSNATLDSNGYFTSQDLPALNTVVPTGSSVSITVTFNTSVVGSHFTMLTVFSNGGNDFVTLTGTASTVPIALLEQETNEGGWLPLADCPGTGDDGCTTQINIGTLSSSGSITQTIRLTNKGGSNLIITKSKPPVGAVLGATNPSTDFSEGQAITPGSSATATVYFEPPSAFLNSDPTTYVGAWTLNTNDLTFGVHVMNFTGTLQPPVVGPLLSNGSAQFQYLGCFHDGAGARVEPIEVNNANNSNGMCQQQILKAGYPFGGTEYTTECWYGSVIPNASLKATDSSCMNYACPGDKTQWCGGVGGYLEVWYDRTKYNPAIGKLIGSTSTSSVSSSSSTKSSSTSSSTKSSSSSLSSTSTKSSSSTLSSTSTKSSSTSQSSISTTSSASLTSSKTSSSSSSKPTSTGPSIPATVGNYNYVGCQSDNTTIRTLQTFRKTANDMTIEHCAGNCTQYTYFGLEYSTQCYCGNTLTFGSFIATDGRCKMTCGGNSSEICGGAAGLTLYQRNSGISSSSSSSSSSTVSSTSSKLSSSSSSTLSSSSSKPSSSSTSTSVSTSSSSKPSSTSSSTSSPTPSSTPPPWTYLGCYNDTSGSRALPAITTWSPNMTISVCESYCQTNHYPLAGVEYANQCYCAYSLSNYASLQTSGCSMACAGNSSQTCGGSSHINIYNYTAPGYVYPQIVQQVVGTAPAYTYNFQGCVMDAIGSRVLSSYSTADGTGMTVQKCVSTCQGLGYSKAGVEYGDECYCGNTVTASGTAGVGTARPVTECEAMLCAGNEGEFCGAANRVLVYST